MRELASLGERQAENYSSWIGQNSERSEFWPIQLRIVVCSLPLLALTGKHARTSSSPAPSPPEEEKGRTIEVGSGCPITWRLGQIGSSTESFRTAYAIPIGELDNRGSHVATSLTESFRRFL